MNKRESKVTPDGLLTLGAELDVVDQGEDKDSSMLVRDHRVTGVSPGGAHRKKKDHYRS